MQPELDTPGGNICEPDDVPLDSRHLVQTLALIVHSDKIFKGTPMSRTGSEDTVRMAEILFGGREAIERRPVLFANVNVNSPLHYDVRMLEAMHVYAGAGQPVIVTPFLLMGAMAPVSIPSALAQQMAEVLTGIALLQLIRPGTPCVMGSFLSAIDMQSGSPSFGGPESVFGLYASGQIARRYGLPWRAGGGTLTASQSVDAQAAYESLNTLLAAFMAGANVVYQSAGWLESGLVACYEKFVLDIELLQMLRRQFTPVTFDEESLAFSAHAEIGPGGYFLGAEHTLERFRECFWRPALASTENFERWKRNGSLDARARAEKLWRADLERYERPALDDAIHAGTDASSWSAGRASSVTIPSRFPALPRLAHGACGGLVAVAIMDASCSLKASTTSRRSRAMRRATSTSTPASSVCGSSRRRSTRTIRASTTCSTPTSSAAPAPT